MASTNAYIKNTGARTGAFDDGPHLGGVIKFVCNRSSNTATSVTVTAYYYLGFGSYADSSLSYTQYAVAVRAWSGATTYANASSSTKVTKTINSSGTTGDCSSNTAVYFSAHSSDSNIDVKTKPDHKTGTIGSGTITGGTSGTKRLYFQMTDNGAQSVFYVDASMPTYNSTVTATVVSANTSMGTVTGGGNYTSGNSITIKATPKTGYSFSKWQYSDGGTGSNTNATVTFTISSSGKATAYFIGNDQTITLNANGGTGGTTSVTIKTGTPVGSYPTITKPTYTGHHFLGYYSATSGGTQGYDEDGHSVRDFTLTAATTGYAHGELNTGKIHFNGNGATSGTMANQTHTYGTALAFPPVAFKKIGYTFSHWTREGSTATYVDQYVMPGNGTSTNGNTYTFTAQGVPNVQGQQNNTWNGMNDMGVRPKGGNGKQAISAGALVQGIGRPLFGTGGYVEGICLHHNAQTVKTSYCIGGEEWYCCDTEGEFQNFTICPDCGLVYVTPTNIEGEQVSCGDCDDESDWDDYLYKGLPASTFTGLTNRTEYTNIYHG